MKELPLPPGSTGAPWLGESLSFVRDPFAFFDERWRQHGPVFRTRILGNELVCLVGPEGWTAFCDESIFSREGGSPAHVQQIFHPDAIPFLAGDAHRRRRRLMLQAFTEDAMRAYQPAVERIVGRYLERWRDGAERRGVDELSALCFDVGNTLFAGADPDVHDADTAGVFARVIAGIFAIPVKAPFTTYGRAIRARDEMRRRIAKVVDAYRAGSGDHVLERMVAARGPDGEQLSLDEVKIETLHFFGAAFEGLRAALCSMLVRLHERPELAEAARAEVRRVAPDGPLGSRLAELDLVHRIGLEVRRLTPIVPSTFVARVVRDAEVLGHRVPAGWHAVAVIHSTMRDEAQWPRPAELDPERFTNAAVMARPEHAYVPHGSGSWDGHRCAGESLATLAIDVFAALALRAGRWELPPQDLEGKMAGLSPLPRDGLRMRFVAG